MLRYVIAPHWWPATPQEHYQYMTGEVDITEGKCLPSCSFHRVKPKEMRYTRTMFAGARNAI